MRCYRLTAMTVASSDISLSPRLATLPSGREDHVRERDREKDKEKEREIGLCTVCMMKASKRKGDD